MFDKKNRNTNKGFTLIELLVVITIISLLSVIAVVAVNKQRLKARNIKRMHDADLLIKAAEMYRKGVAAEHRDDCSVCDTYHQFATLLKELPKGAINLHKETFEESAKKALKKGDRKLASQLYELTAIGWSRMEIEGTYGRFGTSTRGGPLHRVNRSWQDGHLKAGNFYEVAAKLTSSKKEEKRLLQKARDVTAGILDTHYCSSDYKLCKDAEKIVERLEFELR